MNTGGFEIIKSGIYLWLNLITGRVLVGQTSNFKGRNKTYLQGLRRGSYGNKHFQRSWDKYSEKSFEFIILERIPQQNLSIEDFKTLLTSREQFWLDHYRKFEGGVYNEVGPVNSPRLGAKSSSEHRAKISDALKGNTNSRGLKRAPFTDEHLRKMSEVRKGKKTRPMSEEAKLKSSATQKGRKFTDEHKKNLTKSLQNSQAVKEKGQKVGEKLRGVPNKKLFLAVERIDPMNGEVKEYASVNSTATDGFQPTKVSAVCLGKRNTHGGYDWKHVREGGRDG